MVGNPNHDPKSGRFTSASGLNKSNSTIGQRGKARVKEHVSAAKSFALGAAGVAVAGVGAALLQGISRPVRVHGTILANRAISAGVNKAEELVATHGPKIASAIAAKGSTMVAHIKNMKKAGSVQHKPTYPASYSPKKHDSSYAKPKVRVPMGNSPKPKVRVPMGRK